MIRLLLALTGLPLLAQGSAETFTLGQVRAQSHYALARHLLGTAGAAMLEHRVNEGNGGLQPRGLRRIDFARPVTTRQGELCKAEVVSVRFQPVYPVRAKDPPAVLTGVDTRDLWALPMESGCSKLGKILEDPAVPGPYFNAWGSYSDNLDPELVRLSVKLLENFLAAEGTSVDFACSIGEPRYPDPRQAACGDRGQALALLDPARLRNLQLHTCRNRNSLCADFDFADPGGSETTEIGLILSLETDALGNQHLGYANRFVRARLDKRLAVFD